jgi:hypothetical protein
MDARNRSIPDWFTRIKTGQVLLPRFQRHQAWEHAEVGALLEAVLGNLPAGAVLVLEVGEPQPFKTRPMAGAPIPTERCNEHLLDGQQRLTALWRSLNDDYEDRTWLVRTEPDEEHGRQKIVVEGKSRYFRNGERYPKWVDNPASLWEQGYIPLRLLHPEDIHGEIRSWVDAATKNDLAKARELDDQINQLRTQVKTYNIPYLSLPVTTPKDVALDVFIKMNTSSVPLTSFDIVVAQIEAASDTSLHDLVETLGFTVPNALYYRDIGNWVLDVAALREDMSPTQASYLRLDPGVLVRDWERIVEGIGWTTVLLEEERVFDATRLPSVAVLPVLAALVEHLPRQPDELGEARRLLRAYLWRAFLTRRYELSVGSRSLQDFRGLKKALSERTPFGDLGSMAPIFDEEEYPLPGVEVLVQARWPKYKDILGRGVLAVSLQAGGHDLADEALATRESIRNREYHHLFPDSILTGEDAGLESGKSYRALNCALITWRTNRVISAKEPIAYLRDRIRGADLGDQAVRERLATHFVPYDELSVGWSDITDSSDRGERIRSDYQRFLEARARMLIDPITRLCSGLRLM